MAEDKLTAATRDRAFLREVSEILGELKSFLGGERNAPLTGDLFKRAGELQSRCDMLHTLAPRALEVPIKAGDAVRHLKTGAYYMVIAGPLDNVMLEDSGKPGYLYISLKADLRVNTVWVRDADEMNDGRFQVLEAGASRMRAKDWLEGLTTQLAQL